MNQLVTTFVTFASDFVLIAGHISCTSLPLRVRTVWPSPLIWIPCKKRILLWFFFFQSLMLLCVFFWQKAVCEFCQDRIWGLGRQGYKCIQCKLLVHKRCHKLVKFACGTPRMPLVSVIVLFLLSFTLVFKKY